jgi:succinylglutamate desuccinylase
MKIIVMAALHGDELLGLKVQSQLVSQNRHDILSMIGHPQAIAKRTRFIEEDLNRSFRGHSQSMECRIAQRIERQLRATLPDLVIDIHTSITDVKKVAIVAVRNAFIESVAAQLDMEAMVIMPKHLTDSSLIGCYPEKSLSLEFGRYQRSDKLALDIARRIRALDTTNSDKASTIPVYEVFGHIDKVYTGLEGIKNLVYNEELGGYPFLAGKKAYESMGGFLARKLDRIQ